MKGTCFKCGREDKKLIDAGGERRGGESGRECQGMADKRGTYDESSTESMTEQRFPEQRFLEDVDYDDDAIAEMLFNA